MNHYVDIQLRCDPSISPWALRDALYTKLHRVLVQLGTSSVGVSFPRHTTRHLGDCLRLHGDQATLRQLQQLPWLGALAAMLDVSVVQRIPAQVQHRRVARVQAQTSPERVKRRLVKRLMQREQLSEALAQTRISVTSAIALDLPFVWLQSASTGQRFKLFLKHGPLLSQAQDGHFNAYGLSTTATLPWF